MGNNPVDRVDPDGGEDGPGPKDKIKVPVDPKSGLPSYTAPEFVFQGRSMSPGEIYHDRLWLGVTGEALFAGRYGAVIRAFAAADDAWRANLAKYADPAYPVYYAA